MHITSIICEYNPLHSGHAYQISRAKEHADKLVCIMSASFVQRGEPAFYDKWSRTLWALKAGADMVVELPCIYSLRAAQHFAQGAVAIACGMGVDSLCFGMENDDIVISRSIAEFQLQERLEYTSALKQGLKEGLSYAAAVESATRKHMDVPDSYFLPNNTLALEYIKAAMRLNSNMGFLPVKRKGDISSSGCRRDIQANTPTDIPDYVKDDIPQLQYMTLEHMTPLLLYALRTLPAEDYIRLPDVSEGLENRIYKAARKCTTLQGMLEDISVKRYPLARIKRILCMALLGVQQADLRPPAYARVLGMQTDAGSLMDELRRRGNLPLITKAVDLSNDPIFRIEQRATDIHAIIENKTAGMDYTRPMVLL